MVSSGMRLVPVHATLEARETQKGSTWVAGIHSCCATVAPSFALTFSQDPGWSRQSTEVPASEVESFSSLTGFAFDDGSLEDIVSVETENHGLVSRDLHLGEESDDDVENDERVKRICLAARRLMLAWQEDDSDVGDAELERACQRMVLVARRLCLHRPVATADEDDEPEFACMRIRLAARRLALSRQEDEDGEVGGAEVEAAATRMGMFARRYASAAGRSR
mmetsp:Transcript_102025/g.264226  ORF Transcript_102025/g.264226 Transcript_102025/m.264226 type:complete len:222 (+) Transcript_102025:124-789(+)